MNLFNLIAKKEPKESEILDNNAGLLNSAENDLFKTNNQPVGANEIAAAKRLLSKYKSEKAKLDAKIVNNEEWWKLKAWDKPNESNLGLNNNSPWLWNSVVSKHADAMDSFPEANILPRMPDDQEEAERLKEIIPVLLEQNDFEQVYSDVQWYKLKQGAGVYGVFWDGTKHNGLGDISIKCVDILNLFWKGGINDIQDSSDLFYVKLIDNDVLEAAYPQLQGKTAPNKGDIAHYHYDDNVDTTNMTPVVDWYYKRNHGGKTVLHFCKFCSDEILFSTENQPEAYPNGWYDHGLYPFIFDTLYKIEGTPCGYGFIDIGKDTQRQIDLLNDSIIRNAIFGAAPRFFIRDDGSVNEEEFADYSKSFVKTNGNLGTDAIREIDVSTLNNIYPNILEHKITELKETTANRDVTNGGTTGGVTAASGIAAMQEASGKVSRDANKASYNAFRKLVLMVIELIRQYYDTPRWFRVLGEAGMDFVQYSNENLMPQYQGNEFGQDMGYRLPVLDVEVSAQKQTPYSKMAQNELALQFNSAGFFVPQNARSALACLEMMDFNHKEDVVKIISQNDQLMQAYQQLINMALALAMQFAPEMVQQIAPMAELIGMSVPTPNTAPKTVNPEEEPANMRKARAAAQESTQV